uniref:Taste receptor type 2 n=1 Tax=Nannospalax galili TaxID=1026970 RepID=A0A8C6W5M0_NANGA
MDLLDWIIFIIIMTEFIIGNCANVFISMVNFINRIKRRKFSSVNGILTALAISRIVLLWAILISWHSSVFTEDLYNNQIRATAIIVWAISNHFNNWLETILSIFYLFKIDNFCNLLFLHLKRKTEHVLLMALLGSWIPWLSTYEGNVTWKTKLKDITSLANVTLFSLINLTPFSISLVCVLLLIYSLCKHLRNMKLYGKGYQDPSTMVHMKALQTVVSFVLLYAIYCLSLILAIFTSSIAAGAIYPSNHSHILVWGNQKQKQALLLVLWRAR